MKLDPIKVVTSELKELRDAELYSEFVFERNVEFVHHQDDKLVKGGISLIAKENFEKIPLLRIKELLKEIKLSMIKAEEFQKPFQEKANLSDKEMLQIYQIFTAYFGDENYKDALKIASLLTFLNPEVSAFWRSKANCYMEMKNTRSALENFLAASMTNSTDVKNHLGVLKCLQTLEFVDEMHSYYKNAKQVMLDLSLVDAALKLDKQMKVSK
jgi:tetratricopeptide (TPR) repeat protein